MSVTASSSSLSTVAALLRLKPFVRFAWGLEVKQRLLAREAVGVG
ncbi:hypothetical protein PTQ19_03770 [Microbacterium esteraromaticum]|nr:hypothetical protein [Microbacterium esteraromaticum]WDH79572.1 hypothetical protein PTQ19_03770 [Microbacterium esteraromaticum]